LLFRTYWKPCSQHSRETDISLKTCEEIDYGLAEEQRVQAERDTANIQDAENNEENNHEEMKNVSM